MEIGKEEETVVVEPVEDPVKQPKKKPKEEPVRVPVPAGALTGREEARELIADLLSEGGRERPDVIAEGEERGISRATMVRVAHEMGVRQIRNGRRPGIWRLP